MISDSDRIIMERAVFLPMLLTLLERDKLIVEQSAFKLKGPYQELIDETLKAVRKDIRENNYSMRNGKMKVQKVNRDESFTHYLFICKGFEEKHNYFNPRIRNKIKELLEYYLYKRFVNNSKINETPLIR
ncbi:hypothetical protein ACFSO7_20600 [Bacillus sp. CGMCC 1.16607]|uniref:hypothetical protein n=1 Tax=Bacillus sp. CGMCC 1.16607 TaxID=3351842 RepID=UPI00362AD923